MLHGYGQSASIFKGETAKFRTEMENNGHQLVYCDAPLDLGQITGKTSQIPTRAWAKADHKNKVLDISYVGAALKDVIEREGPFDGTVAFSQGSMVAQLFINHFEELGNKKPLKFALFVSGVIDIRLIPDGRTYYLKDPIEIPTMLILAKYDAIIDNDLSLKNIKRYTKKGTNQVLLHDGYHCFPSRNSLVSKMVSWCLDVIEKSN